MIKFENFEFISGGVCAADGFVAGGINAGIKKGVTKNDLAVIYSETPCVTAAVYTTNKVKGAPIIVTQEHLENHTAKAVVVNSGNANTCNENGIEIANQMCLLTANELDIDDNDVIVASTGVIGQTLDITPIKLSIGPLVKSLSREGGDAAMEAIMTTDTVMKQVAVTFNIDGKKCTVGGMCKGSGMINPNMATMLCFVTTDVNIRYELLEKALHDVNDITFNMVCVDGDTSTNDMVTVMSSGKAENKIIDCEDKNYELFVNALYAVMMNLARSTAKDGEGATKLIECICVNAGDLDTAKAVAKSVVSSSLVKAALFAADANWGRILCAMGYSGGDFDVDKVSVELASEAGKLVVCTEGKGISFSEEAAKEVLSADEVKILIDLHSDEGEVFSGMAWGCDLTFDYVKINAEYRT